MGVVFEISQIPLSSGGVFGPGSGIPFLRVGFDLKLLYALVGFNPGSGTMQQTKCQVT